MRNSLMVVLGRLFRMQSAKISDLDDRLTETSRRITKLEKQMAKDRDALAQLDAELDALETYVKSDEDNDAAEIEARTNRVREMLAAAQGTGAADQDKAVEVENKLDELNEQA